MELLGSKDIKQGSVFLCKELFDDWTEILFWIVEDTLFSVEDWKIVFDEFCTVFEDETLIFEMFEEQDEVEDVFDGRGGSDDMEDGLGELRLCEMSENGLDCGGEHFHIVTASPRNIALGSMRPASV